MTRICDSSLVSANHKLGLGLSRVSLDRLCKKLTDPKTPNTCKLVSCIGANGWKQRLLVEKSFGLDPSKSSTLSGPLRPRSDLWELKAPGGPSLLLDSEMPNFENEVRSNLDNSSFIKLSALSSCIYVFLNESDFDVNDGEVKLSSNVLRFFEKLSKRIQFELTGSEKKVKNVFIILSDFKSFEKKVKMTKLNRGELEKELSKYFPKNLYIKQFNDKLDFAKDLKSTSTLSVQEVVEVLRSFTSNTQLASALDYLSTKSFQNMNRYVDESLEKALKNEEVEEFAKLYQAQLLDSRVSYYTLAMQLLVSCHYFIKSLSGKELSSEPV
ncbi:hypothetical protein MACJ_000053 [Theileria orientalis]|uniref:Uncharacterized protein n=1 Tax=Theileria orientalis TaxID=68886 RepID=A0A976M4L0_THEOR|nr:hypothetical protein MACJ_000053 [Theileria orientalis]